MYYNIDNTATILYLIRYSLILYRRVLAGGISCVTITTQIVGQINCYYIHTNQLAGCL